MCYSLGVWSAKLDLANVSCDYRRTYHQKHSSCRSEKCRNDDKDGFLGLEE